MHRTLAQAIAADLPSKMAFLAGPRQVGKTTLARELLAAAGAGAYFNWDARGDRARLLAQEFPQPPALLVFDELHKYRSWKRWVKGTWDTRQEGHQVLVTGSARLDVYRRGGDSLQGRYNSWRLHPLSLRELAGVGLPTALPMQPLPIESAAEDGAVAELLARGGFPEPLLSGSERTHRRWQRQRLERFVREDVRDVESVRDLSQMELLADVLPARVGSPLSLNSLREDLEVSHGTVSRWVEIFDRLYYVYRVPPYATRAIRGLKKEQKVYLWEWSQVEDPGARFENLVASHLLKLVQYLVDAEGYRARLHYVRDRDKREVDFLVCVGNKPWFLVEAKLSETSPAPALRYFGDRLGVSLRYQVVRDGGRDFVRDGVHVVPAGRFLRAVA